MSLKFRCNVLVMEYPGYGLYTQESASAELISENSKLVIEFLINTLGYEERDIILIGRSMGSGPACEMASLFTNVAALVLISPYTSLKAATRTFLGSIASMLVRERFDNLAAIQKVKC
jgi:pimeloyl-ACP methyl ester carboxylesterase